jgi:tetratricopeptide (TPR) repeat protein
MLRRLLIATLALAIGTTLPAQRLGPPADRPRLRDVTDTNDAQAYYDNGLALIERDADAAAASFYWAARINPAWGEAIYARRAALVMRDRGLMRKYFERNYNQRASNDLLRLDSLQFRALMLNPFLFRRLDRTMFQTYYRNEIARASGGSNEPSRNEIDYYIDQVLRSSGPGTRGWLAYSAGDFRRALDYFATALDGARDKSGYHIERARIFGMRGQVDSSVAEFDAALGDLRKKDQKDLVIFYDSKAQAEFSKAVLKEGAGDVAGAREAYAQALTEDLAYYPAHLRLGLLALGAKDTTTAMSELALAAQIATDEPHIRYVHGWVLAVAGHDPEALAELKKSVELEPFYALPYLRLGQLYERMGKGPEALAAYEGYLARASLQDTQRQYATERMTEVKEILALPKP